MESESSIVCGNCGKTHLIPDKAAGKRAECVCGKWLIFPVIAEENPATQRASQTSRQIDPNAELGPTLSIDFGTTRTKVAYWNVEKGEPDLVKLGNAMNPFIPSAFYLPIKGTRGILVGDEALDLVHVDPSGVVIGLKKEIHRPGKKRVGPGRPAIGRIELVSHIFRFIRERCEDDFFRNKSITRCMLSVPVAFESKKRECIVQAASQAGFTEIELIEEPVAAAKHWLSTEPNFASPYLIVCDIGGGTTDFALLKNAGGSQEAVPDVIRGGVLRGGNDVDEDIFESAIKQGDVDTETATSFRSGFLNGIRMLREVFGKTGRVENVSIKGKALAVDAKIIDTCVGEFSDFVITQLEKFIEHCQSKIPDLEIPPILLVGGGSKILGLRERLAEHQGWQIITWHQSDFAIVLGAANKEEVTEVAEMPTPAPLPPPLPTPAPSPPPSPPPLPTPAPSPPPLPTPSPSVQVLANDVIAIRSFWIQHLKKMQLLDFATHNNVELKSNTSKTEMVDVIARDEKINSELIGWTIFLPHLFRQFGNLDRMYVYPEIPEEKLTAAAKYLMSVEPEDVLVLYDDTFWRGGSDGFCLTSTAISWQNLYCEPVHFMFIDIYQVELALGLLTQIVTVNGENLEVSSSSDAKLVVKALKYILDSGE